MHYIENLNISHFCLNIIRSEKRPLSFSIFICSAFVTEKLYITKMVVNAALNQYIVEVARQRIYRVSAL